MDKFKIQDGKLFKLVFCKSKRQNGRTVYPKRAKAFAFWVEV